MIEAIVYSTNTGSTARYAKMLGERLRLPALSLPDAVKKPEKQAEVLYLGWVRAGRVTGYAKAKKRFRIRAVGAVGMAATGSSGQALQEKSRIPAETPVFVLQGNFQLRKLHGLDRLMMEIVVRSVEKALSKKESRTAEEAALLEALLHGENRVTEQNLQALQDWAIRQRGDRA